MNFHEGATRERFTRRDFLRNAAAAAGGAAMVLGSQALPPLDAQEPSAPVRGERDDGLRLTFGLYTHDTRTATLRSLAKILDPLEEELAADLKVPVRIYLRIYTNYEDGRRAIVTGTMDFMRIGAGSYIRAKSENPGIRLILNQYLEDGHRFDGVIFTHQESGVEKLSDLKGRSFAFGDPNSTVGRYLAQAFLLDAGIRSSDLHSEYLMQHKKVVDAVVARRFAAGVAKRSAFEGARGKGLVELRGFDGTGMPWVAREGMDPDSELFRSIRRDLLAHNDKGIIDPKSGEEVARFEEATDKLYDPVRIAMEKAEHFAGVPADHSRGADEK